MPTRTYIQQWMTNPGQTARKNTMNNGANPVMEQMACCMHLPKVVLSTRVGWPPTMFPAAFDAYGTGANTLLGINRHGTHLPTPHHHPRCQKVPRDVLIYAHSGAHLVGRVHVLWVVLGNVPRPALPCSCRAQWSTISSGPTRPFPKETERRRCVNPDCSISRA